MDQQCFDEIISLLNDAKRKDLIKELLPFQKKIVDEDYKPTKIEIRESKKEYYSDSEGSAEEETLTYSVDQSGFYKLELSDEEDEEDSD